MTRLPPQARARILHDMGLAAWTLRDTPQAVAVEEAAEIGEPVPATKNARPSWDELQAAVAGCTRCALAERRQHTVFGVGARGARWMIVGEAPGAEEDRRGEPFVGRAGQLLDAMLAALGSRREEAFITNIVKCRPPGNRDPKPEEADACQDYLLAQIEHVRPELVLALGGVAAHRLLGVDTPVGRLRGRVHEGPGARPLIVTYHPAYLLRTPTAKRQVWEDLQLAQSQIPVRAS